MSIRENFARVYVAFGLHWSTDSNRIQRVTLNTVATSLTYDATSWGLRAVGSWYRSRSVRGVVVAVVAWQQPVLLGPTIVIVVGLRDALLSSLHHLLVLAPPVLEPDLHLQQIGHAIS
jgi:hypothetical protein